ncbi:MAG: methyltransferase-like protein [Acidobacteriaceae bacterium]|nr:methyltransferase-like protein [Acidobacteriaceae bacterium]
MSIIDRVEGRRVFGRDSACYHEARPGYPEKVFDILRQRCDLRAGSRTFEIGAGTGLSTRRLLELGASPLIAVEPDERLADFLIKTLGPSTANFNIRVAAFENVDLPVGSFDLGTSASAFHWLDETNSLSKIGRTLREGGWWAMWWNLFFDGSRTDEFQKATHILLKDLDRSPTWSIGDRSFALDRETRIANLLAVKAFGNIQFDSLSWTTVFDRARVQRLYSTFSAVSRLDTDQRQRLLDDLGEIADKEFGGVIELRITTPMYTAQCQRKIFD